MRLSTSLVQALLVVGVVGCGTTVNVQGDDDDGEGGAGGGGSTGQGGQGSVGTTTTSTGTPPPTNPAECPSTAPNAWADCDIAELSCAYLEEQSCTVSYTCVMYEDCYGGSSGDSGSSGTGGYGGYDGTGGYDSGTGGYDGGTGGYDGGTGGYDGGTGGYGDCYEYGVWTATDAACESATVECAIAQQGDPCALPGEYCSGGGGECEYTDKWCGEDHRWNVEEYYDECCYDECCYDECCDSSYCPAQLPAQGDFCDPCWDSEYCSYEIQDECGLSTAYASCSWETFTWEVETWGCGTGGAGGGYEGTGGGYEGTGGAP